MFSKKTAVEVKTGELASDKGGQSPTGSMRQPRTIRNLIRNMNSKSQLQLDAIPNTFGNEEQPKAIVCLEGGNIITSQSQSGDGSSKWAAPWIDTASFAPEPADFLKRNSEAVPAIKCSDSPFKINPSPIVNLNELPQNHQDETTRQERFYFGGEIERMSKFIENQKYEALVITNKLQYLINAQKIEIEALNSSSSSQAATVIENIELKNAIAKFQDLQRENDILVKCKIEQLQLTQTRDCEQRGESQALISSLESQLAKTQAIGKDDHTRIIDLEEVIKVQGLKFFVHNENLEASIHAYEIEIAACKTRNLEDNAKNRELEDLCSENLKQLQVQESFSKYTEAEKIGLSGKILELVESNHTLLKQLESSLISDVESCDKLVLVSAQITTCRVENQEMIRKIIDLENSAIDKDETIMGFQKEIQLLEIHEQSHRFSSNAIIEQLKLDCEKYLISITKNEDLVAAESLNRKCDQREYDERLKDYESTFIVLEDRVHQMRNIEEEYQVLFKASEEAKIFNNLQTSKWDAYPSEILKLTTNNQKLQADLGITTQKILQKNADIDDLRLHYDELIAKYEIANKITHVSSNARMESTRNLTKDLKRQDRELLKNIETIVSCLHRQICDKTNG